jgi:hypothetical protein
MSKARKISKVLGTSDKLTATAFANVTDLAGVDVYADSDTFVAAVASGTVRQGRMAYFRNSGRIKQRRGSDWNEMTYEAPLADASYTIQSVTPNPVDEGVTVTAYIHVINDDSTIYWTINGTTEDFSAISGSSNYSVATPGGVSKITYSHVITFNTIADLTTEGNETFILSVRTDSISGTVKDTYEFSVNDTSESPPPIPKQSIKIMTDGTFGAAVQQSPPILSKVYDFTVPNNVYSICYVLIGAGGSGATTGAGKTGSGGGGGGLAWENNVPVTPGEVLTVKVGRYGFGPHGGGGSHNVGVAGGPSEIWRGAQLLAYAEGGRGGPYYTAVTTPSPSLGGGGGISGTGTSGAWNYGGNGRSGYWGSGTNSSYAGSGGGAAGYVSTGGSSAGMSANGSVGGWALDGSGGSQAGRWVFGSGFGGWLVGGWGGGMGVYGQGFSATSAIARVGLNGQAGSGGDGLSANSARNSRGFGGGGASSGSTNTYVTQQPTSDGSPGCVRILWGDGRAFPSTNVDFESSLDGETEIILV